MPKDRMSSRDNIQSLGVHRSSPPVDQTTRKWPKPFFATGAGTLPKMRRDATKVRRESAMLNHVLTR